MQSKNSFFSLFFLFVLSCSYGQQDKTTTIDILKKATEAYNKQDYVSYTSKYALYLDYTSKKVHEQYNGIILKKNKVNYFKIKNTEFVSFSDYGLKINHDEKAMILEKAAQGNVPDSPMSLTNFMKGFNSKSTTNKDFFICELTPSGKFSQSAFRKVILYIRKKDYSIAKEFLFFVENMETKNAKGKTVYTAPRLEIIFSPRVKNEKVDNQLVKKANYFSEKGNTIVLSKRLSAYKLYKS
jgi:hypothetical protein